MHDLQISDHFMLLLNKDCRVHFLILMYIVIYLNCLSANSWEEGEEIVLISCRLEFVDLDIFNGSIKEKFENFTCEL